MNNPAISQIKKYGSKGRAVLINKTVTSQSFTDLSQTSSSKEISLYCYIGRNPSAKTESSNARRTSLKILAIIDNDFNGVVNLSSKVRVDGRELDVTNYINHQVNGETKYVEIIANG